jgi:shikimate kinase
LRTTASGSGAIVTVSGTAGMGKSRLGRLVIDEASALGYHALDIDAVPP